MGTMFDVVVYHESRGEAERAIAGALAEIGRIDRVLSHFDPQSELSALVGRARRGATAVSPDLYDVIARSLEFSRLSAGKFDVTVAPLVQAHRRARDEGRPLSEAETRAAQACVGYEKIELAGHGRIAFHSSCLDIDLGGIGKGYAVDRALRVVRAAGIDHAVVNAGGSSIGAAGKPPGGDGWPVQLGDAERPGRIVSLRDGSVSTSQPSAGGIGDIVDPQSARLAHGLTVSVFAPSATASDALATTLLMLPVPDSRRLLARFEEVSALWLTPSGTVAASFREPLTMMPWVASAP